jgi:hypothetical protein
MAKLIYFTKQGFVKLAPKLRIRSFGISELHSDPKNSRKREFFPSDYPNRFTIWRQIFVYEDVEYPR